MKLKERKKAIELRKKGLSIKDITKKIGVAKSSVSIWVRDVELTFKQKKSLKEKMHSQEVVERRRLTRLKNEKGKRDKVIQGARKEIKNISNEDLF